MTVVLKSLFSLAPVLVFLALLMVMDSFKLVKLPAVLRSILAGCLAALLAMVINSALLNGLEWNATFFRRYPAPAIEEVLKALYVVILLRAHRIGFMVDGAIHGFAVGAGFALVENLYYLYAVDTPNLFLWVVRGFGTAVMHGGTTAIFAIFSKNFLDRKSTAGFSVFLPGLLAAIVVHSLFNHFLLPPFLTTLTQLVLLPMLIFVTFNRSEKALREWMNLGFDTDVQMLEDIKAGRFSESPAGEYLHSLRSHFPGELLVDMLCLLRLQLELACRAKGLLLLREAGFPTPPDPEVEAQLSEMDYLRKSIGKTGELALSPILEITPRDLWQIHLLKA